MARPEKISDIEVTPIEFGTLRCDQISAHPTAVGRCEYSYLESMARTWAEGEGLAFPPEHEPIGDLDSTLAAIDEAAQA